MGKVDFGGVRRLVCLEAVPDVAVGDYVLVHVGMALARIDEAEAQRVFALLSELERAEAGLPPRDSTGAEERELSEPQPVALVAAAQDGESGANDEIPG